MKILSTSALPESVVAAAGSDRPIEVVVARAEEELLREIGDADALIGSFGGDDGGRFRRLMTAARKLRWVHTSSAGVDALLCPELERTGAALTCAKGEVVGSLLAEHAFALLLGLTRGIVWSARQPAWDRAGEGGRRAYEIRGQTLGIVGFGGTGRALARRAAAFEMDVLAVRRSASGDCAAEVRAVWGMDRLDALLAEADVVVTTVPGTPETRGMFNEERFRRMKPGAVFINVGRGETVCTEALVRALQEGRIAAAGLDVTDPEPLPADSPLWKMDNVVVSPHIAGNSPQRAARNQRLVQENLRRFMAGEPLLSVVDLEAGY